MYIDDKGESGDRKPCGFEAFSLPLYPLSSFLFSSSSVVPGGMHSRPRLFLILSGSMRCMSLPVSSAAWYEGERRKRLGVVYDFLSSCPPKPKNTYT